MFGNESPGTLWFARQRELREEIHKKNSPFDESAARTWEDLDFATFMAVLEEITVAHQKSVLDARVAARRTLVKNAGLGMSTDAERASESMVRCIQVITRWQVKVKTGFHVLDLVLRMGEPTQLEAPDRAEVPKTPQIQEEVSSRFNYFKPYRANELLKATAKALPPPADIVSPLGVASTAREFRKQRQRAKAPPPQVPMQLENPPVPHSRTLSWPERALGQTATELRAGLSIEMSNNAKNKFVVSQEMLAGEAKEGEYDREFVWAKDLREGMVDPNAGRVNTPNTRANQLLSEEHIGGMYSTTDFQTHIKATNLQVARENKAELAAAAAGKQRLADARAKALRELQAKQKGAAQFESLAVMNAKADLGDAKREAAASKRALENTKGSFAPKSASLPDLASAKNRRNRNDLMKDHRERLKAKLRAAAPPIDEPEDTKESPTRAERSGSRGRTPPPVPSRSRGSDGQRSPPSRSPSPSREARSGSRGARRSGSRGEARPTIGEPRRLWMGSRDAVRTASRGSRQGSRSGSPTRGPSRGSSPSWKVRCRTLSDFSAK
jgi:hypothetical protein